jgi:hypothetical protein
MIQDDFRMSLRPVELEDIVELDHGHEGIEESATAAK